ncbi:hypothetical protein CDAR_386051 [Caerostris darwini]|uniref:Transposase n=1 Tax=Caerostris darwini TaxID=1538125 RepID=A0AAV4SQ21_9ARAC|nr:hypothetical protein CDAR_386051 [Caerostris darwini]
MVGGRDLEGAARHRGVSKQNLLFKWRARFLKKDLSQWVAGDEEWDGRPPYLRRQHEHGGQIAARSSNITSKNHFSPGHKMHHLNLIAQEQP